MTATLRPKIVGIVQARMRSERLPEKVMLDIAGLPMLARVVERASKADTLDQIVVATSHDESDTRIAQLCDQMEYRCFRGHPTDVLDRYRNAARSFDAQVVVRITADCPLIDAEVIDTTVGAFLAANPPVDFAANRFPDHRTYPIGLDTEVCTAHALEIAWSEAVQPYQREHVMPYFYDEPGRFRILHVEHDRNYGGFRWTVDYPEDLEVIREVYARFGGRDDFSWLEVIDLFENEPELARINSRVRHKDYREADERPTAENARQID